MKKYISMGIAIFIILSFSYMANAQDFTDVQSTHINSSAIEYLKENKVIEGYTDGNYKPENRINRAEFVKIIIASKLQDPKGSHCFKDVKDEWFAKYVCSAKSMGYIQGYADGTFKPGEYINFAEASKIITKAMEVKHDADATKEWYAGYVNALAEKKAIPTTIQFFDKNVSRGEMAEMIWRLKENKTDKISQDYDTLTQDFPSIRSCAVLQEKFKEYQSYNYGYDLITRDVMMTEGVEDFATAPMAAKSESTGARGDEGAYATDFSTTNIQVEGVDEADIIKNDGKYIYMIKGDTVRIVEAYPASAMKQVGEIDFNDKNFRPSEMFVNGDQLIVIGQSWSYYSDGTAKSLIYPPRPWQGYRTNVYILDIKDKSAPKEERKVVFDGNYFTSRRIGDNMYLVMNEQPDVWIMNEIKSGEDLLPRMQDGDKAEENMVGCADMRYFPGFIVPNYLIVASIPLNDPDGKIEREVFLGSSDNVYSSVDHLYVATNQVNYEYYTDWDWRRDNAKTLIFKFALEDGKIDYINKGSVPGRILNQFSMDANGDHFRIATTIESWNPEHPSGNNVYVLNKDMQTVGSIEEIAPGERIYSTRFLGDRLYMVTFRQVDPLFVIDMSSPTNPKILGKLKIPGFSQYLHPFDADHIIGFGQETEENKYGNVITTGFKMALFDVSDVADPKQKFVEHIGDSGTHSELLHNHKALLFDKNKELLAFPINIIEKIAPEQLDCGMYRYSTCPALCEKRCIPSSCEMDSDGRAICTDDCEGLGSCLAPSYERSSTTFSGAVIYALNATDGFSLKGKITHFDDQDILKMGDYWPYEYNKNIQRIIYIGEHLYTISQSKIRANDISSIKFIKDVDLK